MPYSLGKHPSCPASKPHAVLKADGSVAPGGCHATHEDALKHQRALTVNVTNRENASGLSDDELRGLFGPALEHGAVLSSKSRKNLPSSAFVFPDTREYPIHDEAHARAALSMGSKHESGARLAKIKATVKRRYPQINVDG